MVEGSLSQKPAWVRLLLPSASDIVFVAMLTVLVFTPLSVRLLGDAGIGWHIRTGQLILATHAIPRADVFSTTMQGKEWFAWEWLYDLLVGWLEQKAGLNAVVWFTAAVIAAVFAWSFRLLVQRGTDLFIAVVSVLLAASASMIHFFARPHVVSWLFVLMWFWLLESFDRRGERVVWLLPLLMLVWVNVHGGFLTGFFVLAIYWMSAMWQWLTAGEQTVDEALMKSRAAKRASTLALVGLVSLGTTLINPHGWRLHAHIYRYLSNRFLMDHIEEFQSPNFHGAAERCFAGLVLITLVALATKRRPLRLSEGLLTVFAAFSGLYASRNIPVSSLLLVLIVGPLLASAVCAWRIARHARETRVTQGRSTSEPSPSATPPTFLERMGGIEMSLHGHLWALTALVVTACAVAHGGYLGKDLTMNAHFDSRRFPDRAVDYLENSNPPDVVLAPDYWGGFLIYRLYPNARVAVDDRHDLYGEQFLKSYLKLIRVEPGWEELLEQYHINCVLAPQGSGLNNILALQGTWREVYRDEVAVVLIRSPQTSRSE